MKKNQFELTYAKGRQLIAKGLQLSSTVERNVQKFRNIEHAEYNMNQETDSPTI